MYGVCCDKEGCTIDGLTRHEPVTRPFPAPGTPIEPDREYVQKHMHYDDRKGGCFWGKGEMRTRGA